MRHDSDGDLVRADSITSRYADEPIAAAEVRGNGSWRGFVAAAMAYRENPGGSSGSGVTHIACGSGIILVRSLARLSEVNLGYNRENLLLFRVDAAAGGYK